MKRLVMGMLAALALMPRVLLAHQTSDSYVRLRVVDSTVSGQWSLALHDLEVAVGLDSNRDGVVTWGELKGRREAIIGYAASRLELEMDGAPLAVVFEPDLQVDRLANGTYAVMRFTGVGGQMPKSITVVYRAFFEDNPLHRGLLSIEQGGVVQQAICGPTDQRLRFEWESPRRWREFGGFLVEGVWHIWTGYDHVLFLLALLLPAVLRREGHRWEPVGELRGAFLNVVKIVTAFTMAHSVTLSLAALRVVTLPSRWVESVIAASIVAVALNNVWPLMTRHTWTAAFGFGLVHGFGFASALADLGLGRGGLVRGLVGFNLGVEMGQLAVVSVFLPLAYAFRGTGFYRGFVLRWGSAAIAMLAAWWLVRRATGG